MKIPGKENPYTELGFNFDFENAPVAKPKIKKPAKQSGLNQ